MQIQQLSTAAGFLSTTSSASVDFFANLAPATAGGAFFDPGGGFFRLSMTLELLTRLRFAAVDEDRFLLDGAEATNGLVSIDLSAILLCLRFLDLVVGPTTALSSS